MSAGEPPRPTQAGQSPQPARRQRARAPTPGPESTGLARARLELDIRRLELSADGLEGRFYWPVHADERDRFNDRLMQCYVDCVARHNSADPLALQPCRLAGKHVLAELMAVYRGMVLRERARVDGVGVTTPAGWRVWPAVLCGQAPAPAPFVDALRRGPARPAYARKLLDPRWLRRIVGRLRSRRGHGWSLDGLKVAPLTRERLHHGIVATQRTPLIAEHARKSDTDVFFRRSPAWFRPLGSAEIQQARGLGDAALEDAIVDALCDLFACEAVALDDPLRRYLRAVLTESSARIRVHYRRLLEHKSALPRHLWTGTGGDLWDAILRLAVGDTGGTVEGHDHATGSGAWPYPVTGFIELFACDRYVTFNPAQVRGYAAVARQLPRLQNELPAITAVADGSAPARFTTHRRAGRRAGDPPTVMVLSAVFDGERGRLYPAMEDIVRADWQARLVAHLQRWGYRVVLKPHPESPVALPSALAAGFDVVVRHERFEAVMDQADILLLDHLLTTSLRSALETDLPMVFVEAHRVPWMAGARELLARRCPIVAASHDADNRLQVDWDELEAALRSAPERASSRGFADTYFA